MKTMWYYITGAPNRMWALYKNEKPTGHKLDQFDTDLLGFVERKEDGSWDCYTKIWIGNEPDRRSAATFVQKFLELTPDSKSE